MLRLRIVSTLIGIPILIGLLFLGKISFFILIAILSLVGLVEFNSLSRKRAHLNIPVSLLGGLGFPILALLDGEAGIGKALILLVFLVLTSQIFSERKFSSFDVSLTILGPIYVSLLLSHLILLQALGKDGPYFVLMVFFGTWAGDIAAYAGGRLIGRRKLAPRISPGKTWEGVVVGFLATLAVLSFLFLSRLTLSQRVLLGITIGLAAPLGDLVESSFKREAKIKDTGSVIPGHGGILDRFDSLLFTGTASYYLLKSLL